MAENSPAMGSNDRVQGPRRAQILDKLIGESPAFVQVRDQLSRISESEATVLIAGETGTGKELTARALHCAFHGGLRGRNLAQTICRPPTSARGTDE